MRRFGLPQLIGLLLVVGVVMMIVKWVLITAAILAVPFGARWIHDRVSTGLRQRAEQDLLAATADRRAEVEGRAVVDAAGAAGGADRAAPTSTPSV
jgi:hypothetical protein